MTSSFAGIVDRFTSASSVFGQKLASVSPGQWGAPTPCAEWDVRQLVNHMTQGNRNCIRLLEGGTRADFLRFREADALGADPLCAYARSVRGCAAAFARPGALARVLDYPLGRVTGLQALAVRTADTLIHAWDLARAVGADDTLSPSLVAWVSDHFGEIYGGLAETPADPRTSHRYFAASPGAPPASASRQYLLIHRMGRRPDWRGPAGHPVTEPRDAARG